MPLAITMGRICVLALLYSVKHKTHDGALRRKAYDVTHLLSGKYYLIENVYRNVEVKTRTFITRERIVSFGYGSALTVRYFPDLVVGSN